MALHLNLKNSQKNDEKLSSKLHWMPCEIHNDGEANVSKYFEPVIVKRKTNVFQGSFRGYPLLGKEICVPEDYTGVVLQESNDKLHKEADRDLYEVQRFDKFTTWNWDVEPSANDTICMALDWLDVAKALHSSVEI